MPSLVCTPTAAWQFESVFFHCCRFGGFRRAGASQARLRLAAPCKAAPASRPTGAAAAHQALQQQLRKSSCTLRLLMYHIPVPLVAQSQPALFRVAGRMRRPARLPACSHMLLWQPLLLPAPPSPLAMKRRQLVWPLVSWRQVQSSPPCGCAPTAPSRRPARRSGGSGSRQSFRWDAGGSCLVICGEGEGRQGRRCSVHAYGAGANRSPG